MFADPFAKWPKCYKCSEKAGRYVGVPHYDVVSNDIVTMSAQVKATCHGETWTHSVSVYDAWHGSEPYALFAPTANEVNAVRCMVSKSCASPARCCTVAVTGSVQRWDAATGIPRGASSLPLAASPAIGRWQQRRSRICLRPG